MLHTHTNGENPKKRRAGNTGEIYHNSNNNKSHCHLFGTARKKNQKTFRNRKKRTKRNCRFRYLGL